MGILAHVDAGKTTLAENLLYRSGAIRSLGRVDHKNTLLDCYDIERARGITVFSKQAELQIGRYEVTLLDTPGHADFSAEAERTLMVLDYAILVISGADGIQSHTLTLWKLLRKYAIPVFLFVNKMDRKDADRETILSAIREKLSDRCIDCSNGLTGEVCEEIASHEEVLMEQYLETGKIPRSSVAEAVARRKIFPCYFGSALRQQGLEEFCRGLESYFIPGNYGTEFGARVFKIGRDEKGNRLTYVKVTGGTLKVKMPLLSEGVPQGEKADQIRVYSGNRYQTVKEAEAGMICALTGLSETSSGDGMGAEKKRAASVLEPVLSYNIILPKEVNKSEMMNHLRELEEEEPLLKLAQNLQTGEIQIRIMGEVQLEILKTLIAERYGVNVEFGEGSIVYKETVTGKGEGTGAVETQRHYAKVGLCIEPLDRGSGTEFDVSFTDSAADGKIKTMILRYLEDHPHKGILMGAPLTDMKITVMWAQTNRHHPEIDHFRQGIIRAMEEGLWQAKSKLLEPVYEFRMEVPENQIGRAISDIGQMCGTFSGPEIEGDMGILSGTAPVAALRGYQRELVSYTAGKGKLALTYGGYRDCHNQEEVLKQMGVPLQDSAFSPQESWDEGEEKAKERKQKGGKGLAEEDYSDEKELEAIFARTYKSVKQERGKWHKSHETSVNNIKKKEIAYLEENRPRYLLVDGYNIIFAWEELKELAEADLGAARTALLDILCNYQGFQRINVIVVFDGYRVKGNPGEDMDYHNIHVVYTKEAETADTYIERVTHEMGKKYRVTVATSDALEQCIIWGNGAIRMSAKELKEEIQTVSQAIRAFLS